MVFGKPKQVGMQPVKKANVPGRSIPLRRSPWSSNSPDNANAQSWRPLQTHLAKHLCRHHLASKRSTTSAGVGVAVHKQDGHAGGQGGNRENAFDMAKKVFHAKLNVIEKAARRKVKPITPR